MAQGMKPLALGFGSGRALRSLGPAGSGSGSELSRASASPLPSPPLVSLFLKYVFFKNFKKETNT